jgi:hypothetical protein
LGSIPDVQSQLPAPSMTTGGVDDGASTIMQYDPQHPELGPFRKRIDYKQGTDYLAMQAKEDAEQKRRIALEQTAKEKEVYNVPGVGLVVKDKDDNWVVKVAVPEKKDPPITQYQSEMLKIAQRRLAQTENKPAREENATQLASRARVVSGIADMNTADAGMRPYETKLMNGTASIDGLNQITGRMANSFTHDDPISITLQSTALAILDRVNPELARYLRQGLTFAEGESMISQRPSDFRTKMAAFLSTAASGASKDQVLDIQHRRENMLTRLKPLFPESGAAAGTSSTMMGTATLGQPFAAPPPTAPPVPSDPYKALPRGKR